MIVNWQRKFLFIHIPRTSGDSMTLALRSAFSGSHALLYQMKHAHARRLRDGLLRDDWDGFYKFAVIRSPWEIIESTWRLTRYSSLIGLAERPPDVGERWFSHCQAVAKMSGFEEYVRTHWLGKRGSGWRITSGGIWTTYCCGENGEDLGVEMLRFDDIAAGWRKVFERIGGQRVLPEYPHVNGASDKPKGEWTRELIDEVGERCAADVEKFGFTKPEVV